MVKIITAYLSLSSLRPKCTFILTKQKVPPVQFAAICTICLRLKCPGWNRKWKRKDMQGHRILLYISNRLHNNPRHKIRKGSQWVKAGCMLHIWHHPLEWNEFEIRYFSYYLTYNTHDSHASEVFYARI